MNQVYFIGESKKTQIKIISTLNQEFQIADAHYELKKGEEIIESGKCVVEDKIISAFLTPKNQGDFMLDFIYVIGTEKFIERVGVSVRN